MRFNTLTFLIFFAVVLVLHHLPLRWRTKKLNLLLASYVFYAAWSPPFIILLWISTLIDWFVGARLAKARGTAARRGLLLLSLGVNLGMLGFFKYGQFLLDNFCAIAARVGIHYQPVDMGIVLPIGISFYTFQTLSYTLDIYMGKMRPWHSFLDYALFVTFFPQLVAGPILRAQQFLPQCEEQRLATRSQFLWGLALLTLGLFEKVILADFCLAPVANEVHASPWAASCAQAWIGAAAFYGQVFCDFAGYSWCAIGTAMCLGFSLPDNFRCPFAAVGYRDFWRRWHISLSTWLRDYLYIPLGGSRKGGFRAQVNMMITMVLIGLWHGASWQRAAWGAILGVSLMVERVLVRLWGEEAWARRQAVRLGLAAVTFTGMCLNLVVFRARSFGASLVLLRTMFVGGRSSVDLHYLRASLAVAVIVGLFVTHWLLQDTALEDFVARRPWWIVGLALAFMLLCLALLPGDSRAYIYFQF